MALEGVDKTLFQLQDKETSDDTAYDAEQMGHATIKYVEMTTRKEIVSWWLFDWANSPTNGVALSFVFPVFLTLMAIRYSCLNNTEYGCDWNDNAINSDYTLRVSLGSWQLKPESYASTMISISSGFQAIAYILFSGLADYANYKIYLYRITAVIAQIMMMCWIFFGSETVWLFAGIWGVITTIPYGLSLIFYNAFLLELVENHWRVKRLERNQNELMEKQENAEIFPAAKEDINAVAKKKLMVTLQDDISEWGFACGYCGSVIVTILTVAVIFLTDDVRVGFIEDIGVNNLSQYNELTESNTFYVGYNYQHRMENMAHFEEWNVLPVIDANIWYSIMTIYEDLNTSRIALDRFSLINGIQFIYEFQGDRIYGDMYGSNYTVNNMKMKRSADNILNVDIESLHGIVGEIGDIKQLNVYQDAVGLIHAVQFSKEGAIFGVINNTELVENKYDDFYLGGYEVSNSFVDITFFDADSDALTSLNINNMEIISGFGSLAFVDPDGPYGSTIALQLAYFLVGLWFFIFAIPSFMNLKSRIREPIPSNSSILTVSAKSYYKTFKKATDYPDLFKYLITWFLFSDAMSTTGSCGVLFGQIELGMGPIQLVLLLIEVELFAVSGAFFFVWFQKKLQWDARQMLLLHLPLMAFLPFYAVFGLVDGAVIGLVNVWEMYAFVAIFGFNQGSIQALSRSLFGQFIPTGYESQFFGLYEITDKGSSWIGPMMVAIVSNFMSMRYALIYLVAFYLIATPVLYFGVDYERGRKAAKKQ